MEVPGTIKLGISVTTGVARMWLNNVGLAEGLQLFVLPLHYGKLHIYTDWRFEFRVFLLLEQHSLPKLEKSVYFTILPIFQERRIKAFPTKNALLAKLINHYTRCVS